MTTKTYPAEQINTAGTMAAFLKGFPPGTPIAGFAELRHGFDETAGANVAHSLVLGAKAAKKARAKKAKK